MFCIQGHKRALSFLLTIVFLFSMVSIVAVADDVTEPVKVIADSGEQVSEEVGNVTVSEVINEEAAEVRANDGGVAELVIDGNCSIDGDGSIDGAAVFARGDESEASVQIQGEVIVTADPYEGRPGSATGVLVDAGGSGSEASAEVKGGIQVEAPRIAEGVNAYARSEDNKSSVNVGGDITAVATEGGRATGVELTFNNGQDDVVVMGSISAKGESEANAQGIAVWSNYGDANISVNGDIIAETENGVAKGIYTEVRDGVAAIDVGRSVEAKSQEGSAYGIDAESSRVGANNITVGGDVVASSSNLSNAVYILSEKSHNYIEITGDATAKSSEDIANGIVVHTSDKGTAEFKVGGDVTASGAENVVGISANMRDDGGNITGRVGGDVCVTATEEASLGLVVHSNPESVADFDIEGSIISEGLKSADGILVEAAGGDVDISVGGDIITKGNQNGFGIEIRYVDENKSDQPDGTVKINVGGDVTGGTEGIYLDNRKDANNVITDITIDGTLSAANGTAVVISQNVTADDLKLTVWKIDLNEDGNAVGQGKGIYRSNDTTRAIEQNINYIIKVEPTQSDIFAGTQETAKEGESAVVKVNVPAGYSLTGAFTDEGQSVELLKDSSGNYYVVMPKGGGIFLSAKLEKIQPEPQPQQPDDSSVILGAVSVEIVSFDKTENAYVLNLSGNQKSMTFLRSTLEKFAKTNDILIIKTANGVYRLSLTELLSINEKAVNFRFELTESALLIYVDGELAKTVSFTEFI